MKFQTIIKPFLLMSLAVFMWGCEDSSSSSSSDSSMTISGSLGGASGASSKVSMMNFSGFAVTDYKVRCVTLSSDPQAGEGDVSSDGSFSLDISVSDDESVPIGCFIVLASDSSVAATFSFKMNCKLSKIK